MPVSPGRITCYRPPSDCAPQITWVFAPGYIGDDRFVASLAFDGVITEPPSMFSFVWSSGDRLVSISHPKPGQEQALFEALLRQLSGRVVLVGLSQGGRLLNRFFRWYHQLPANQQTLIDLGFVPISTPPTANQLRQPFQRLVKLVGFLRLPRFLGQLMRLCGPLFISKSDQQILKSQGLGWVIPRFKRSTRGSTWIITTLRALADGQDFGPAMTTSGRVAAVHLSDNSFSRKSRDEVVNVTAAIAATKASYPDCDLFWLSGTHHGVPEIDGPAYRRLLEAELRPYFARLFGLSLR